MTWDLILRDGRIVQISVVYSIDVYISMRLPSAADLLDPAVVPVHLGSDFSHLPSAAKVYH